MFAERSHTRACQNVYEAVFSLIDGPSTSPYWPRVFRSARPSAARPGARAAGRFLIHCRCKVRHFHRPDDDRPDDDAEPRDLVDAIRARRAGKLLNLDRMLLHIPPLARRWNSIFRAIRAELALSSKLRGLAIISAVLNQANYEWVQHGKEFLAAGGTTE